VVPAASPVPPLGNATLAGEIVNATNNQPVAGADVRLVGTRLHAKSDSQGRFRISRAPSGPIGVEISAAGYSTDQSEKELASGKETFVKVAISPGLKAGQIRLVLTWNKTPADVDAHLEGPLPDRKRFHIYFQEKGDLKSKEFVNLDVDAREGLGPETITVLGVLPGRYHYFVHNYSGRDNLTGTELAQSGAEVKVYQGGQTYRFRPNGRSPGTIWHVCDIEVTDKGAIVHKLDTYESKKIRGGGGTVDIVFLMDTTGSMSPYIDGLKQKCIDFAARVGEGGRDVRLGLIGFGDVRLGESIYVFDPTKDIAEFQEKVRAIPRTNGGDDPESPIDALERALPMHLRPGAVPCFVVITDASCHRAADIPKMAKQLEERGVITHVVSRPEFEELYKPLCVKNGKFHSLTGAKFEDLLLGIADDVKRYVPVD
jgi:uncharacterized protein YfaP (DUF2135 family)